ncbi:MAG: integrase [Candidatus Methylomirabilis sp.]
MTALARGEYLGKIFDRYNQASRKQKKPILDEFCRVTEYHRKYAIRLLRGPFPRPVRPRAGRPPTYKPEAIRVLIAIWKAAGYACSIRLKALLPTWMPWARKGMRLTDDVARQVQAISPRQIDRRLREHKREVKRRLYGRTKPGTLLKHHIPVKVDRWKTTEPGFTEVDLVSHCGGRADGEFIHSFNITDIHTTWVETRAVLGKSQIRIQQALDEMREVLPFTLQGIDSDNGSEFINGHLFGYCRDQKIQFTRGRPYKKDDNAHIEQKNWTHVRKLLGYVRYDTSEALAAINKVYRNELRLLQNLFLPSVKLVRKERVGSKTRRRYDPPQTPFERVLACKQADPAKLADLKRLRERLDPFELSRAIDRQLERIYAMRCAHVTTPTLAAPTVPPHPWRRSYKGMRRARSCSV